GSNGTFVSIHTAIIDGQAIIAMITSDGKSDGGESTAILENITIDASVLSPLAHAVDTEPIAGTEGITSFEARVLVPADWTEDPDAQYAMDAPGGGFVQQ